MTSGEWVNTCFNLDFSVGRHNFFEKLCAYHVHVFVALNDLSYDVKFVYYLSFFARFLTKITKIFNLLCPHDKYLETFQTNLFDNKASICTKHWCLLC